MIFFLTCRRIDGSLCNGREDMVLLPTNADQHAIQQFIFFKQRDKKKTHKIHSSQKSIQILFKTNQQLHISNTAKQFNNRKSEGKVIEKEMCVSVKLFELDREASVVGTILPVLWEFHIYM